MPVTISPRFRSVSGGQNSRQIGYVVRGAETDNEALDELELNTPIIYDGMPRESIEIDEIDYTQGHFFATVTYSRRKTEAESGAIEYNFDISLSNQKVVQSLSTVNSYVASGDSTDFKKAIAVDADGVPQGVDIRVPISSFEIRYYPLNAIVTTAYQKVVRDTVGKVNSTLFNGHAAGEVLFVGCSGSIRNDSDWELSYRFEVQPNQTGITIGDITGISVDGWDVLWVYYKQDTDDTTKRYIQIPKQVNVERVYERADFATVLGI
jgi:hypothetical protein